MIYNANLATTKKEENRRFPEWLSNFLSHAELSGVKQDLWGSVTVTGDETRLTNGHKISFSGRADLLSQTSVASFAEEDSLAVLKNTVFKPCAISGDFLAHGKTQKENTCLLQLLLSCDGYQWQHISLSTFSLESFTQLTVIHLPSQADIWH